MFEKLASKKEITLNECYQMAIHRSESLKIESEELIRIQSLYQEAIGAILPNISLRSSYIIQDVRNTGQEGFVSQSFRLKERTEYKLALRQPIFSGMRELYSIRQFSILHEAKEHQIRHLRLNLFLDVSEAFYTVLLLEKQVETMKHSHKLASERLEELVQRNKAKMSRRSEVLSQEAQVYSIEAQLEKLKGVLSVAWEALKFVTGLSQQKKLEDTIPDPNDPLDVEKYIQRALAGRSDVIALQKQIKAEEESIGIALSGYLPSINLDSNYYTHRMGISKGIDWDILLTTEIPIFEGGKTQAKLREAHSNIRKLLFKFDQLTRNISLSINKAWADIKALQSERVSLAKALKSAQENYELVQAEYRQNIATNIEELTAFNALQKAKLELDRVRFEQKLALVELEIQSGSLPLGLK